MPGDEQVDAAAEKEQSWSMWGRYMGEHHIVPAKVPGE